MCQSLGWTWDYVEDNLTVARLAALQKYWRRSPPTHVVLAWHAQFKPQAEASAPAKPPPQLPDVED